MRSDAELGVGCAITAIRSAAFNNLEKESFAVIRTIELEIFAVIITVVEDVFGPQPVGQIVVEVEPGFQIIIIIS